MIYKTLTQKVVPWIIVMTSLFGCKNSIIHPEFSPSATLTAVSTFDQSNITRTVVPIKIHTVTIPAKTVTHTLGSTPTSTPAPLTSAEKQKWLLEIISSNGGCSLPCWWGGEPGKATWEDVFAKVRSYASWVDITNEDNRLLVGIFFDSLPDVFEVGYIYLGLEIIDGVVQELFVDGLDGFSQYQLPALMAEYGEPGGVWVDAYSGSALDYGPRHVAIHVYYPNLGILAQYDAPNSLVQDGILSSCLENGPLLWLRSPEDAISYEDFVKGMVMDYQFPYLPVSDALGMDVHTFYNMYKSPNQDVCLKTPVDLWVWGVTPTP